MQMHGEAYPPDEERPMTEDDSDPDERDGDYADADDGSSSPSIPNESIDFDLVYSLHGFAATVEGQASVVKGDSLVLMDDSNSYWWLVRVLRTQEIGYIPAENIATPFERLARLNKDRNIDVCFLSNRSWLPYLKLCHSWLRLRRRKCRMAFKRLVTTFAITYLPVLAPITRHHPLRLAMTHVALPAHDNMHDVPSFSLLLCRSTVTLPPYGETTRR